MTDTEPMYLISESELKELVEDSSEDTYGSFDGVEIGEKVRARGPVTQHDAAIATQAAATERERVLDSVKEGIDKYMITDPKVRGHRSIHENLWKVIESLRSNQPGSKQERESK